MKKVFTLLFILLSFTGFSQQVRITQVYGAGGDIGSTYNQDFIELFNSGYSTIDISGWSVQYASATGSSWSAVVIPTSTSLAGGKHFLIGLASGATGNALPIPDVSGGFNISNTEGKVALVNTSTLLSGTTACSDGAVVDVVGYGATASCYKVAPVNTAGITNDKSCRRQFIECFGANNNSLDFMIGNVSPRNSTDPTSYCTPGPMLNADVGVGNINVWTTMGASYETQYLMSGSYLDNYPGNITVTASTGIEVSLTSGSGYASSVNIPYSSATLDNVTIYLRVNTAAAGIVNGTITHTGGGATAVKIVLGTVLDTEPTVQTSNIVLSNFTDNTMDISWASGNGNSRVVVIHETNITGLNLPQDGRNYTANTNINLAPEVNTGNLENRVIYSGTGNGPVTVTGLLPSTNYTVSAFEFNGSSGTNNYLLFNNGNNTANGTTTGDPAVLLQRNFFGFSCPLYMASGNSTRMPTMFQATIENLLPNTTYRYYVQAAATTDLLTYSTGSGDPLLIDYTENPVTYTYTSTPSLTTAGCYGKFTTNGAGSFSGHFGFVHNADTRFTAGDSILPAIALAVDGSSVVERRYALTTAVKVLQFSTGTGPNDGTFIKGNSFAPNGRILFLYKSSSGAYSRPLTGTIVEGASINNTGTAVWGNNFITGYDNSNGSWNAIIPNVNPEGVQLIQAVQPAIGMQGQGAVCARSGDGIWPIGPVVTNNPTGGTTPLLISSANAPLLLGDCIVIVPVTITSFEVKKFNNAVKLNWITVQEINSKEFIIERSTNGTTWTSIATVPAVGNSSTRISYTTTDNNPVKGINFYRIRIVDLDNKFNYSATKSVLFNAAYEVLITPNPARDIINVYVDNNNRQVSIVLLDASGKLVRKISSNEPNVQINTSLLARGMYYVKVINESDVFISKILLQ